MELHDLARIEINGQVFENVNMEYDEHRKETHVIYYSRSGPVAEFKIKAQVSSRKYTLVVAGQGSTSIAELNPGEVKKAFKEIFTKAKVNAELSESRRSKILAWLNK